MCNLPTQLSPQDQSPWLTRTRPRHGGQSLGLLGLYISNASRLPLTILRWDRSTNLVLPTVTSLPHTPLRMLMCAAFTQTLRQRNSDRERRRNNVKEDRAAIRIPHQLVTESGLRMLDSHNEWTVMTVVDDPRSVSSDRRPLLALCLSSYSGTLTPPLLINRTSLSSPTPSGLRVASRFMVCVDGHTRMHGASIHQ